jgi:transposase-like protein
MRYGRRGSKEAGAKVKLKDTECVERALAMLRPTNAAPAEHPTDTVRRWNSLIEGGVLPNVERLYSMREEMRGAVARLGERISDAPHAAPATEGSRTAANLLAKLRRGQTPQDIGLHPGLAEILLRDGAARNGSWPAAARAFAVKLFQGCGSLSAATKELGLGHRDTLGAWVREAGFSELFGRKKEPHPPELRQRALALVAEGATIQAAADKFGVPYSSVRNWCRSAGIKNDRSEAATPRSRPAVYTSMRSRSAP